MLSKKKLIVQLAAFGLVSGIALPVFAESFDKIIITSNCLIAKANIDYRKLATEGQSQTSLGLFAITEKSVDALSASKQNDKKTCPGGFRDVTQAFHHAQLNVKYNASANGDFLRAQTADPKFAHSPKDYEIRYKTVTNKLIGQIEPETMWSNLTTFSNFTDRHANSENGVKAAAWLKEQVEQMAVKTGHEKDVTVFYVNTGRFKQPSVVAKFGQGDGPGIVIGAHMDTEPVRGKNDKKPGADDDGSGTVTVLETARTLLTSGVSFTKPIYFIFYAAEERGLVGSGYVVSHFRAKKIAVDAVIHFDMTGYAYKNDTTIWLIKDYVNADLTNFLEKLVKNYTKENVNFTKCGYACSDHASWTQAGFAAAIPFEAKFGNDNPYIHTAQDTIEHLSLKHMTNFAKIGVAFATELAKPVSKK